MTRYIRVDYSVRTEVNLDELKTAIGEFVAGIRRHHPEHRYTSFQHPADPFRFIHIGEVVEERRSRISRSSRSFSTSQAICGNGAPPHPR